MSSAQIAEFLLLLDRKTAITSHSVTEWQPEYSTELQQIEKELNVLRVAADQDRGRASSDSGEYVPTMITLSEAAKRTGLSYDWLRKMALSGKIRSVRAGSKILINFERLLEYLDQGDQGAVI